MELTVRTRNGKLPFSYHNASASQVNQVLEQIQTDLRMLGRYTWRLEGYTGQYKIVAHSPQGTFTEAIGKSPSKALQAFGPARRILWEKYRIHP